jgi:hypothetical protein
MEKVKHASSFVEGPIDGKRLQRDKQSSTSMLATKCSAGNDARIQRHHFDINAPIPTPMAIPGPIPMARLSIATPMPSPIATPKHMPAPMNFPCLGLVEAATTSPFFDKLGVLYPTKNLPEHDALWN